MRALVNAEGSETTVLMPLDTLEAAEDEAATTEKPTAIPARRCWRADVMLVMFTADADTPMLLAMALIKAL